MKKVLPEIQRREVRKLIAEQNDIKLARWFINNQLNPHDYLECLIKESSEYAEPYGSVAIQLSVWRNELDKAAHKNYDTSCEDDIV